MSAEPRREIGHLIRREVAANNGDGFFREPLVGFARADDPLFGEILRRVGPHHLRPADILPEGRTVVSFFLPFTDKVVSGNRGPGPVSRDWGLSYLAANVLINRINGLVIDLVTAAGGTAASVPATHTFDEKTLQAGWSHRSAALVAGLGRFGLNRMLIGPSGAAGRYGTVFISPEIDPDPRPEDEPCLYFKSGRCQACVRACPVEALTTESFDGHKCYAHVLENSEFLDLDGRLCDVCGKCVVAGPCAII